MELKAGYKQTEVGVIPEDWDVSPFFELTVLMTNGFVGIAKTHYTDNSDGILYIQGYNVENNGFNFNGIKRVTSDFHKKHLKSCLQTGDLLTVQTGDVGLTTIVPEELAGSNCHALIITRVKHLNYDSKYLSYYLNSSRGRERLKEIEVGTTMKHINVGDLLHFQVPFPRKKSEQTAIASALSDMDALLDGLDRLITKKRNLKQAAMQQLLTGKTRLVGFEGEWEVVNARDIGRFRGGSGFPTKLQGELAGEYPFFKVSDMNNEGNETFMKVANNHISESIRKDIGAVAFPANSIVFAKVGAAIFLERKKILAQTSCLDNNMAAFVLDATRTDCRFIHYLLLNMKLGDLVSTTALPSLNGGVLAVIEFILPSIEEQEAIAAVLSDMDAEIAALEQRRTKTRDIKQGMMQELLTGRTRLV